MKTIALFIMTAATAGLTACSHTREYADRGPASERNWKVDYTRYVIDDVVNAKTGKSVFDDQDTDPHIGAGQAKGYQECRVDLDQRDVVLGKVEIHQYSDDTYIRSFRTITVPNVQAKFELKGLNFQCHYFRKNNAWAIRNLAGKSIGDIFEKKYHGQKLGVDAAVSIAVNPNEAILRNGAGVVITNVEQMLDTATIGIGINIAYATVKFDQSDLTSKNESVLIVNQREDGTTNSSSSSSFVDALKIKL